MALPKFSVRDLLWLVVVVAMGFGWWLDRAQLISLATNAERWRDQYETLEMYMKAQGYEVTLTRSHPNWSLQVKAPNKSFGEH